MAKRKRGISCTRDEQREVELKELGNRSGEDIDYNDIPLSIDEQLSIAVRDKYYQPLKSQVSVRNDADEMVWLKPPEKDYRTRLTAILREEMQRDQNKI